MLARDELARKSLIAELDENAMERWPNSEETNETGFTLASSSNEGMFDILPTIWIARTDLDDTFRNMIQLPTKHSTITPGKKRRYNEWPEAFRRTNS
ncbi:hypothetical protein HD806DRAFT_534028 [Xylariaceae sp. AK1471]|nr:hypothetical protein HD806DRAFT_534028 [Xylariaceae sp. AK1471]